MTKRLVDIDDELLEQARLITGALTMKDTVNAALQNTVDAELRLRHAHRIAGRCGTDIADDEVMSGAWR
ncbi:MAG: type II toxin-antitoxin system VapB family antitoxin [Acidimicrobiales bacterium]|nr:type II toxin-antitoxin system VapB family antitoxin [Acidimicrobiales bacterium]MYG88124.1 type II toxin-antitoxin system VapB family antitoxin [Acidimicrobiales bacterium]MYI26776.1 type II toxin-antitoxin system VapB family antitoxin [Acidimicrobiales bacterium]